MKLFEFGSGCGGTVSHCRAADNDMEGRNYDEISRHVQVQKIRCCIDIKKKQRCWRSVCTYPVQ